MLPCQNHDDEGDVDAMAGTEQYWMRFFAALRMTVGRTLRSSRTSQMTNNPEIIIGSKGSDYVSLKIISGPDREGWYQAEIEVRCDGFSNTIRGQFWEDTLADFAKQVRELQANLIGPAILNPLEPNIELTLKGDGKGHINVTGVAQNHFERRTRLHFEFNIDQTYLKSIADDIDVAGRR